MVIRRSLLAFAGLLTSLAVASMVQAASAPANGKDRSNSRIDALIHDLGDPSYRKREVATRQLAQIGLPASDALKTAERDSNREVRNRVRPALGIIMQADLDSRLESFSAGIEPDAEHPLPGLKRFRSLLGKRASRELFVAMLRAEPDLVGSVENDPQQITALLTAACGAPELDRDYDDATIRHVSSGAVGAMLLASLSDGISVPDETSFQLSSLVYHRLESDNNEGFAERDLRRLIGMWIAKEDTDIVNQQKLRIAIARSIPEGLSLAQRVLRSEANSGPREIALLTVAKFGDQSLVDLVESCLQDTRVSASNRNSRCPSQVRDIALATLLHLTKQDPKSYGMTDIKTNSYTVYDLPTISFVSEETRDAGLKQWREWRIAQAK